MNTLNKSTEAKLVECLVVLTTVCCTLVITAATTFTLATGSTLSGFPGL
ncbi:MAG: hypothetical protein ACR2QG_00920 [Gammaproteobacteria bacterium]